MDDYIAFATGHIDIYQDRYDGNIFKRCLNIVTLGLTIIATMLLAVANEDKLTAILMANEIISLPTINGMILKVLLMLVILLLIISMLLREYSIERKHYYQLAAVVAKKMKEDL